MSSNENPVPVITVDGPSASGKGTICRLLAQHLGWHYLDSGALYRAVGLAALWEGVSPEDESRLIAIADQLQPEFRLQGSDDPVLWINGRCAGNELRGEDCAAMASVAASMPGVRSALLQRQRAFQRPPGLVADGRDMGTVVFPNAHFKVFLTATPEARAERRYKQLKEKGVDANISALLRELVARDQRDSTREVAPLRPAPGALQLDTTRMAIEDVVERVLALVAVKRTLSAAK